MSEFIDLLIRVIRKLSQFKDIYPTLISLFAAGFGAYLGYRLSIRHFRKTKKWDRENSAHEACYNKICDVNFFYGEYLRQKAIANDIDPEYFEPINYDPSGEYLSDEENADINKQDYQAQVKKYEEAKHNAAVSLEKLDYGINELIDLVNRYKKFLGYSEKLHEKINNLKKINTFQLFISDNKLKLQEIVNETYKAWEDLPEP